MNKVYDFVSSHALPQALSPEEAGYKLNIFRAKHNPIKYGEADSDYGDQSKSAAPEKNLLIYTYI